MLNLNQNRIKYIVIALGVILVLVVAGAAYKFRKDMKENAPALENASAPQAPEKSLSERMTATAPGEPVSKDLIEKMSAEKPGASISKKLIDSMSVK